jgi:hypothetical protein
MPNQTITVQFTVQNEDDFFGTLEDVMMSDQTGFSSYTVLSSSDIARDEYNRPSKSDLSVAYNRLLAEKWRILYGEFLENEILSDKFSSFEDILFEIEGSHTPYCVMEFIEGVGWECYQDFMGGEEIYYSSLLDQPE